MKPIINDFIFYKITNEEIPDYVYIGSTSNFIQRKYLHKSICNNPNSKSYNLKIYQTIRENGGWILWQMTVVDKLDQVTLTDARIKEEELRLKYNGNLNARKAYISVEEKKEYDKEYNENHKNEKKEYDKEYSENNKDELKEKAKEYYVKNKDEILEKAKEYNENHKYEISEKMKEYYVHNKNELSEKAKEYRENHKYEISEKMKEKMTCECGSIFRKCALSRHLKSNKHLAFINK